MRALAALMVLVYHVVVISGWQTFPDAWLARPLKEGWMGVDMFLVISGFVITLSAARAMETVPHNYRSAFMWKRFWRIAPLYVLTSLVFLLFVQPGLFAHGAKFLAVQGVTHALFIHNLSHHTHGAINGPTWSIGLEMQFYVLVVLCIPWLVRQRAWVVVCGMVLVSWLYRYWSTLVWPPGPTPPIIQMIYATQLPGTLDNFAFGIALALVKIQYPNFRWLAQSREAFVLWFAVALLLTAAWWWVFWPKRYYWSFVEMIVFWRTLLGMAAGAWLAALLTFPWQTIRGVAPFVYLGKISYGLYLWHMPILLSLKPLFGSKPGTLLAWVLVLSVLMASLSWHGFEKHLSQRTREQR